MTHEDFSQSPNPRRLYKNKDRRVIAGVCAGLADYFNIDVTWVRIGAIAGLFTPASSFVFIGYIIAWIVMPVRSERMREPLSQEEDQFWRGVSRRPEATFSNLRYRFRHMDERLADIERVVTSKEWKLRRQFREIE